MPNNIDSRLPPNATPVQPAQQEACLRFARQNPICYLSTLSEDGQWPQVRTLLLWRAESTGFYFILFSSKTVLQQIRKHPNVQICFHQKGDTLFQSAQMRLSGKMEILQDKQICQEASQCYPLQQTLSEYENMGEAVVCRLSHYSLQFWSMQRSAKSSRKAS